MDNLIENQFSFKIKNKSNKALKLFNGYNEIVAKVDFDDEEHDIDVIIPKGLYTLRIESDNDFEDRKYRVDSTTKDLV